MTTVSSYRLPQDLPADIDTYEQEVQRFLRGETPGGVFKAKRVPRGVYEQREDGTYMVRVRVAAGTLTPVQTAELAAASRAFGNGVLHVTTRQDIQFHDVAIENTPAVMRRLLAVGLTSKGGGGNTVRNIMACPYAGICPAECFDVTACAHAVTEYLITLVGSYNLPRKYKIAFSGCAADCGLAQVADLGFVAETRDGQPGFRVLAGGGMGANSRLADTLLDWVPASDIVRIAETVRRLFDRMGDRTNRHRARLRYVFERIGRDAFRREFDAEAAVVAAAGVPLWSGELPTNPAPGRTEAPQVTVMEGIRVVAQRQAGYYAVPLHLPHGFLPAADLARIGVLAAQYSAEGGLRTTRAQNLLIRFVKEAHVPLLATALRGLATDVLTPVPLDRFVVCAGSSTCRLGICLARNAAQACADALADPAIRRDTIEAMEFYLNGCPNACGQQPLGPLGFFGSSKRSGGHLVPCYRVTVGGRCHAAGARFGTPVGTVPAASLASFVRDTALDFQANRQPAESFIAYSDRVGIEHFAAFAERHAAIPPYAEHPEFYRDLGADEAFSLAGRGAGECGAGVFEVIQEDLAAARKADDAFGILLPTARALLITRGVDARDPDAVLREFERHFIDTKLVGEEFRPLLARARARIQGWEAALDGLEQEIGRLRDRVELLHSTLDGNLEFHPPEPAEPVAAAAPPSGGELDLSGVACPMNFVKAKLKLEPLATGSTLALVLDDGEPVRNVPASFKAEGQEIEETTDLGNGRWRVVVRKRK